MSPSVSLCRLRLLVMSDGDLDPEEWDHWQAARSESPRAADIALQKRMHSDQMEAHAVGVGFEETLSWFGPIRDSAARRLVFEYAESLLANGAGGGCPAALQRLALDRAGHAPDEDRHAAGSCVVLLSHAETDLLVVERARRLFPRDMPSVRCGSLANVSHLSQLLERIGSRNRHLVVIVRVHGLVSAVSGLDALVHLADREGWSLITISGTTSDATDLPRSHAVTDDLVRRLSRYFMEGGSLNVAHALRYVAAGLLQAPVSYQEVLPMPAHGLYHPDLLVTSEAEWNGFRDASRPCVGVLFYRAHVLSANLEFVDAMIRALEARGLSALGIFTSSLRERDGEGIPCALRLLSELPDLFVSTVSYPVFILSSVDLPSSPDPQSPFERLRVPLLQGICCAMPRSQWQQSARGLPPAETAMNVALPECDGRITGPPISFKESHRYVPDAERLGRLAGLAQKLVALRRQPVQERRVAIVLNNSGGKAQRVGSAVGLDVPASLLVLLRSLGDAGYVVGDLPASSAALMDELLARGSYDARHPLNEADAWRFPRERYAEWFERQSQGFQDALSRRWGTPQRRGFALPPPAFDSATQASRGDLEPTEPHTDETHFKFAGLAFGNVIVAIQPPRAYGMDTDSMYHAGDLPPTHHYAAFYRWLSDVAGVDAVVHLGAHGTLEWLPGKSVALSGDCAPDVLLGELPLVYSFVVNNPGEAAQAKRRTHAVIVDHLTPPVTEAGVAGALVQLGRLVEDYYRAEAFDPAKLPLLRQQIWHWIRTEKLEAELRQIRKERHGDHIHGWDETPNPVGLPRALDQLSGRAFAHLVADLDAYLCDIGRAQIRSGLHVLGRPPEGEELIELLFALTRRSQGSVPALSSALACALGVDSDKLAAGTGVWQDPLPRHLQAAVGERSTTAELRCAIDELARALIRDLAAHAFAQRMIAPLLARRAIEGSRDLVAVLEFVCGSLAPRLANTTDELDNILLALCGLYVPAGPSGSPLSGMAHVLPTGRNLYTVDPRTLPTPAAWVTGQQLASGALERYRRDTGTYPETVTLSLWGTPAMRTGGDDLAQALALIGVRPCWDKESRCLRGFEPVSLDELGRPRIDVTLRVSGFFRDAFPSLIHLFAEAAHAVAQLPETPEQNFVRKHWLVTRARLLEGGQEPEEAARRASLRVFSSKPGHYGTGVGEALERGAWNTRKQLGAVATLHAGWAYSDRYPDGLESPQLLREQLSQSSLVLHTQDVAENDIFDSSEVFEYQGGLIAAIEALSGTRPRAYLGDTTSAHGAQTRTLQAQAFRVFRSRVLNPKWHAAMRNHGYRGAMEMAASVEAAFGFAATAGLLTDEMFQGMADALAAGENRGFLQQHNVWALNAIAQRLLEAHQRGLWSAPSEATLQELRAALLQSETTIEQATESSA